MQRAFNQYCHNILTSTVPSGKLNLFWTTAVSSLMRRPFSPSTFWVRVARMMISVRVGVTRTSTPLYPSSANSRVKNSLSSALKTPSATNYKQGKYCSTFYLQECTGTLYTLQRQQFRIALPTTLCK